MNTPHTPGPWLTRKPESSRPESARLDIVTEAGDFSPSFVAGDALPQDARLIASAPDLLDALNAAYNALAWPDDEMTDEEEEELLETIREALLKAKGE